MTEPSNLALFWASVIAFAILVYVILDGFDLGIGILFGTTRQAALREQMIAAIAPFWDGNETWLVVIGASLFAAFPAAYAVFLAAFYIPVLLLVLALIFRGVAFEFRVRGRAGGLWDIGFFAGSAVAAFVQGAAVGAMIPGIPVVENQYSGGSLDWIAPLPILSGIGLMLGYALLGAGWLVLKSDGALQDWAWRRIPWLVCGVLLAMTLAFFAALTHREQLAGTFPPGRIWGIVFPLPRPCRGLGRFCERAAAAPGLALCLNNPIFHGRLTGGDLLALHDPLCNHRRRRGGARIIPALHVLGCWGFCAAGDCDLHGGGLLAVSRQAAFRLVQRVRGHWCLMEGRPWHAEFVHGVRTLLLARHSGARRTALLMFVTSAALGGCAKHGAPSFVLFGAFFPAWMLCALIGIFGAIAARSFFVAVRLDSVLPLQLFVYSSIGLLVAVLTWLIWFGQ
jgi:cytochrome bd-type quinol oxidase subunit 2